MTLFSAVLALVIAAAPEPARAGPRLPEPDARSRRGAPAGTSAEEYFPVILAGRVQDDAGKPVRATPVWLYTFDESRLPVGDPVLIARTESDAQGRFRLDVPLAWQDARYLLWGLAIWAGAPGGPLGVEVLSDGPARICPRSGVVVCVTHKGLPIQVLTPEGRALPGARLVACGPASSAPTILYPKELLTTNARGAACLYGYEPETHSTVEVRSESYGIQTITAEFNERPNLTKFLNVQGEAVISLRPAVRVEGRLVANRPALARGVRLNVESGPQLTEGVENIKTWAYGSAAVVTDAEGRFVVPALAYGKVEVRDIAPGQDAKLSRLALAAPAVVAPGATHRVVLWQRGRTRLVRGIVRRQDTGAPVAGLGLRLETMSDRPTIPSVTDAAGHFEAEVPTGFVSISATSAVPGYCTGREARGWDVEPPLIRGGRPRPGGLTVQQVPAGAETYELKPIELVPAVTRLGRLQDKAGRPLAGWLVRGLASPESKALARYPSRTLVIDHCAALTDEQGRLQLQHARDEPNAAAPWQGPPAGFMILKWEWTPEQRVVLRERPARVLRQDPLLLEAD